MRSKGVAILLAFFFGYIGGHKFYLGQTGLGLVYLFFCWTFIPATIAFFEMIMLILMSEDEFNRRYNFTAMLAGAGQQNQVAQSVVVNMPGPGYAAAPPPQQAPVDVTAKLAQLNDLRVAGALTDEEYTDQKRQLLGTSQAQLT